MNKKKGFTLVELMAVIIILAVIALIAVPIVTNIITESRKNSLKDSAHGIIDSATLYYANQLKNGLTSSLEFNCTNNTCQTSTSEKLEFKGTVDSGTLVLLTDGTVQVCISNGKYAVTNYVGSTVTEDVSLDEGSCDGITLISETDTLKKALYDTLVKLDSDTTLTKNNTVAELNAAIDASIAGTTATPSTIKTGYNAWVGGNVITGTYNPLPTTTFGSLSQKTTATTSTSLTFTVNSGKKYLLTVSGARNTTGAGMSGTTATFTNMTCTNLTLTQTGGTTYTYVQLAQYVCDTTGTAVTVAMSFHTTLTYGWTYNASMIELGVTS